MRVVRSGNRNASELPGKTVRGYAIPEKVLLSMHDFRKTPKFPKRLSLPARGGANAIKVAAMARSIARQRAHAARWRETPATLWLWPWAKSDCLRACWLCARAVRWPMPVASATAPGQIPLLDLKNLYRAHELTQSTRIYGVIGNPIAHSLSPSCTTRATWQPSRMRCSCRFWWRICAIS